MSSLPPASTRDVAIAEIKLLRRGLPGMRTVLPRSHALFAGTNYSITRGASLPSIVEMGEWEKESEAIMHLFVEDCLGGASRGLAEISSGVFHDVAAFATHLAALGHRTPSSLISLNPEDLRDHLEGSPDLLTKIVLRCSCNYYSEFQHLTSVYTRANTERHVTLGDLVDNRELMAYNQKMGPLFDRNPESVKAAGSRVTNIGTGEPHQSWLPYRHKDHHLPNKEPSLYQRSTTAVHEKRAQRTSSSSPTLMAGLDCMLIMLTIIATRSGKPMIYSGSEASALPHIFVGPTVGTSRSVETSPRSEKAGVEAWISLVGRGQRGKGLLGDPSQANFKYSLPNF